MSEVLNSIRKNLFSSFLLCGPLGTGKISFLRGLCHQFFKKMENSQILHISSMGRFLTTGINKKIDDFQLNHFYSKKLTKIIIFENFESYGNMVQLSMRERMQKQNIKTKFMLVSKFFSKINHAILSRCMKIYFNFIYPNQLLLRFIEILNKENIYISIEILQYSINLNGIKLEHFLEVFFYSLYSIKTNCKKKSYFYHREITFSIYTDNYTKEGKLSVLRKLNFYKFHDFSQEQENFHGKRKQVYSVFPLINF